MTEHKPRCQINLKLRAELLARIDATAQAQGINRSEFIRAAVVAHLENLKRKGE